MQTHTTGGHVVKRRVSKACDACRKSKTKCDGERPCSRCLKENKLCTYSNSNLGYTESKCKKLYNQEYVDLLETRNSLLTKALTLLFKQFDLCLDSGLVQICPEKYDELKRIERESAQKGRYNNTCGSEHGSDQGSSKSDASSTECQTEAWINLSKNRKLFMNAETGKLNVNEVVYSIIPTNVDMAVKSLNYTHNANEENGKDEARSRVQNSLMAVPCDQSLSNGYVNSSTLFTSDHSKEGKPEEAIVQKRKRKRQKARATKNEEFVPPSTFFQPTQQQNLLDSFSHTVPVNSMHRMPVDPPPPVQNPYHINHSQNGINVPHDYAGNTIQYPIDPQQWYPKIEYRQQLDLLDPFSTELRRQ